MPSQVAGLIVIFWQRYDSRNLGDWSVPRLQFCHCFAIANTTIEFHLYLWGYPAHFASNSDSLSRVVSLESIRDWVGSSPSRLVAKLAPLWAVSITLTHCFASTSKWSYVQMTSCIVAFGPSFSCAYLVSRKSRSVQSNWFYHNVCWRYLFLIACPGSLSALSNRSYASLIFASNPFNGFVSRVRGLREGCQRWEIRCTINWGNIWSGMPSRVW